MKNMYQKKGVILIIPILVLCLTGHVSCCTTDAVRKATNIAKDAGMPGAGDNFNVGECVDDLLECKNVSEDVVTGLVKECQVKGWLVGLSVALIVIFPLCILACCVYLCFKRHCFSRIIWWISNRKSQV